MCSGMRVRVYQLHNKRVSYRYEIIKYLLYRQECFTGKYMYAVRKIHMKLHPGPEWRIFHILTSEDIADIISRSFHNFLLFQIFFSLAALVRKIILLFLPLKNKIHIFTLPCNILYL